MSEIKYRQAASKDIPQMIEIWKEFIDFHKIRDSFFTHSQDGPKNFGKFMEENLCQENAVVYVAEKDRDVIAHILATIQYYPPVFQTRRYGLINDLAVTSLYRRSGIGKDLFDLAKVWFRKKGIKRVEIEVINTNEVSTSFWRKMDFVPYKQNYYLEL